MGNELLAEEFERARPHLRAVAYRMLGSLSEAEDAVQESWLRLSRTDTDAVINLRGWLTTVVGRVSLDMLRARRARREDYPGTWLPEPIVSVDSESDPEHEALLADSVGLALLVVLETLTPPERLAFVLHDMFGVPFEEIAEIVGRSPAAARQLASRARRRVRGAEPGPDADLAAQRARRRRVPRRRALGRLRRACRRARSGGRLPCRHGPRRGARPSARQRRRGRGAHDPLAGAPRSQPSRGPAIVNGAAGFVVGAGRKAVRGHRLQRRSRPDPRDRPRARSRETARAHREPGVRPRAVGPADAEFAARCGLFPARRPGKPPGGGKVRVAPSTERE